MPQAWHYTTTLTALSGGKTIQNTAKKMAVFFCNKIVKNEPKNFFSAYCNCEYFDRKGGCLQ